MQEWRTQHIAAIHMRTKNSGEGEQEQKDPGARTKVTPQATETGETPGPKQKYLRPLPPPRPIPLVGEPPIPQWKPVQHRHDEIPF